MPKFADISLNSEIRVKLTPEGEAKLHRYHEDIFHGHVWQQPDEEGFYWFMLWDFANIFGPDLQPSKDIMVHVSPMQIEVQQNG